MRCHGQWRGPSSQQTLRERWGSSCDFTVGEPRRAPGRRASSQHCAPSTVTLASGPTHESCTPVTRTAGPNTLRSLYISALYTVNPFPCPVGGAGWAGGWPHSVMRKIFRRFFPDHICVSEIFDSKTYSLLPKVASLRFLATGWIKRARHRGGFKNNPVQSFRICYIPLQTLPVSAPALLVYKSQIFASPVPGAWHIVGTQHSGTAPAM